MFNKELVSDLGELPKLLQPVADLVKSSDVSDLEDSSFIDLLSHNRSFVGRLCLLNFVQDNWVGPKSSGWGEEFDPLFTNSVFLSRLELNTQTVYHLSERPALLFLSKLLLLDSLPINGSLEDLIWACRCIRIWQSVLDEPVTILCNLFDELCPKLETLLPTVTEKSTLISVYSELCLLSFTFYKHKEGLAFLQAVIKVSGIQMEFAGALGIATKFQTDEKSQLYLEVSQGSEDSVHSFLTTSTFPMNKALDDDTLLPETKFSDPNIIKLPDLTLEQQVVICLKLYYNYRHVANDDSNDVERKALISALNRQDSKFYSTQFYALFQRCILEGNKVRYLDRLLMQMEHLTECFDKNVTQEGKFGAFFALPLPTKWEVQKQYGEILSNLGCTATALEVFKKLELWEQAAVCLVKLDRRHDGAELIRAQLEINPSAKMWCLLGDVTSDIECYHKALEMTNNNFARAFKSLGIHYVQAKEYEFAIKNFDSSLQCNSLQPGVWYTLACCAMGVKSWQVAMRACQTYVKLEPDNAEAWCNLGVVFLNVKDKERAYRAFSEAVKHSFHNWKIWENLLYVSIDIHAFSDAIRAMKHIMTNNKDKRVDLEALKLVTHAIIAEKEDFNNQEVEKNRASLIDLLAFMTTKLSTNSYIWEYYGDIYFFTADDVSGQEKGIRNYFRALRQLMNSSGIETKFSVYSSSITRVTKIIKCFNEFVNVGKPVVQEDMISEFSGILRNLENFVAISKNFPEEVDEKVVTSLDEIRSTIDALQTGLTKHSSANRLS